MTHMLELECIYSYQSYSEDILSNELSVLKWDILQAIGRQELGNRPSSPLGWFGQSQEGSGSLDEDIQTKGLSYHRKHHLSFRITPTDLLIGKCPSGQQTGRGRNSLNWDWTKRKSNAMSLQLSGGNNSGGCACARFRAPVI